MSAAENWDALRDAKLIVAEFDHPLRCQPSHIQRVIEEATDPEPPPCQECMNIGHVDNEASDRIGELEDQVGELQRENQKLREQLESKPKKGRRK